MDIKKIIERAKQGQDVIWQLRDKSIEVPAWSVLKKEFDPNQHPVMDRNNYPDIPQYEDHYSDTETDAYGNPVKTRVITGYEKVSRITYDLQALAVKRTTELCFGVPVKRVYKSADDGQREVAKYLEAIFQRNRIDSVNIDRGRKLFACCEVMTLWYGVLQDNVAYGFKSKIKLRCVTYSPMQGDELYPLFDERGDLVALSVAYRRKVENEWVSYFDTYTEDTHLKWSSKDADSASPTLVESDDIIIGKIPAIYVHRPMPVWENTSGLVYEMEWAVSRNGNYLRTNSRPILMAAVSEELAFNNAPATDAAFRDIVQYPQGSNLQYVTWNQAIDNLKFYIYELRQMFFTQLQLPDWSYENMKSSPMSGEARKQLFIDCQLKVKDESGRLLEFFDREINVVKAFLKVMLPGRDADIDGLAVENVITPYTITDEKDTISLLLAKNGNKPLMSQKQSIEALGESEDAQATMDEILSESMTDALGLAQ